MMLRLFGLLGLWLLLATGGAWAQVPVVCPNDSRTLGTGALPPGSCFHIYTLTGQQLDTGPQTAPVVLCAGSRIRVRYCGGEAIPLSNIRYGLNCDVANTDTVTTLTVPTVPGRFTILQQRTNPYPAGTNGYPAGLGLQYSREFIVRAPPAPAFQVRYCGSPATEAVVTVTNAQATTTYSYQFNGGSRQPLGQPGGQRVPLPAGATSLTVFGIYNDAPPALSCEGNTTQNLPARPTAAVPVLQRLRVQSTGLDFAFASLPTDPSFRYVLERDGGVQTDVPAGTTAFSLAGGPLTSCYRLRLLDACDNVLLSSVVLCPVDLQVSSANRQNRLAWTQPAGSAVTGYEIRRNDALLATVAAAERQYIDSAVSCGVTYRYRVTALTGAATSESREQSITTVAASAPPAPRLTASFRLDNGVEIDLLSAVRDTATRLRVRRLLGNTTTELPASRRPVVDQPGPVTPANVPCYVGRLTDPCGNATPDGPASCPPVLAARATDRDGNFIDLNWAAPAGQGSGWRYRLILLDANNQEISSSPVSATTLPTQAPAPPQDRQILRYRLEATSSANLVVYSNVVTITRELTVIIPTAFTPNGDGLNDQLEIKGRFLKNFDFKVFDRNGLQVFHGTDRSQTWDGRIRGTLAAPQVFAYQFEATDEIGQRIVRRGTVTILR